MYSSPARRNGRWSYLLAVIVAVLLSASAHARADEASPRVQTLLKERLATIQEIAAYSETAYKSGAIALSEVLKARERVADAELDLCETNAERIKAQEKLLELAKNYEEYVTRIRGTGEIHPADVLEARAKRLKTEIALERLKAQ